MALTWHANFLRAEGIKISSLRHGSFPSKEVSIFPGECKMRSEDVAS